MSTLQYPPGYLEENVGYKVVITAAVFIFLDTFFVALRYVARYLGKVPMGVDDYLIAASWVVSLSEGILYIVFAERYGFGRHSAALKASDSAGLALVTKGEIAIIVFYCVSCVLPRLAILCLYLRIFPQKSYRVVCYTIVAALIGIFSFLAIISGFQCTPLSYLWDKTIPGHCIDINALYRWTSLPNIIADISLLVLPLPAVWKLHAPRTVKVGLMVIFASGGIGLITAVVRAVESFHQYVDEDVMSIVPLSIYSIIETGMYLIAACASSYRPLYKYAKQEHAFIFGRHKLPEDDEELQRISAKKTSEGSSVGSKLSTRILNTNQGLRDAHQLHYPHPLRSHPGFTVTKPRPLIDTSLSHRVTPAHPGLAFTGKRCVGEINVPAGRPCGPACGGDKFPCDEYGGLLSANRESVEDVGDVNMLFSWYGRGACIGGGGCMTSPGSVSESCHGWRAEACLAGSCPASIDARTARVRLARGTSRHGAAVLRCAAPFGGKKATGVRVHGREWFDWGKGLFDEEGQSVYHDALKRLLSIEEA